jgi:hypothetical protein
LSKIWQKEHCIAIITWPEDAALEYVLCLVCHQRRQINEVTAFFRDSLHPLEFICASHIWNTPQLILGITDFMTEQRQTERMKIFLEEYGDQ